MPRIRAEQIANNSVEDTLHGLGLGITDLQIAVNAAIKQSKIAGDTTSSLPSGYSQDPTGWITRGTVNVVSSLPTFSSSLEGRIYYDASQYNLFLANATEFVPLSGQDNSWKTYTTLKTGPQADDWDSGIGSGTEFSLTTGTFNTDGSNLYVYFNGLLQDLTNYQILTDTKIQFTFSITATDKIMMVVPINAGLVGYATEDYVASYVAAHGGSGGSSTYVLPEANTITLGGVTVGSNINVSGGQISVPIATSSIAGVIKQGTNLNIASDGTLSVPVASATVIGLVKIDNASIKINGSGQIYADVGSAWDGGTVNNSIIPSATTVDLGSSTNKFGNIYAQEGYFDAGSVSIGTAILKYDSGVLQLANDGTTFGNVILTTTIGANLPTASNSVLGGVKIDGSSITIDINGVISSNIPTGLTAGSSSIGFIAYHGTTQAVGQFDGGGSLPSSSQRLNYDGALYANVLGIPSNSFLVFIDNAGSGSYMTVSPLTSISTNVQVNIPLPGGSAVSETLLVYLNSQSAGYFDVSSTAPLHTNRLNYDGDLYVHSIYVGSTSLYVNNKQVITDQSSVMTFQTDTDQGVQIKTTSTTPGTAAGSISFLAGNEIDATAAGNLTFTVGSSASGKTISFSNSSANGGISFSNTGTGAGNISFVGNIQVANDIIPATTNVSNLGSSSKAFQNLYLYGPGGSITFFPVGTADSGVDIAKIYGNVNSGVTEMHFEIGNDADDRIIFEKENGPTALLTIDGVGNVTIPGNLTISGTTTTVSSQTIQVSDSEMLLNYAATGVNPIAETGVRIRRAKISAEGDNDAKLLWNETSNKWQVVNTGSTNYDILYNGYSVSAPISITSSSGNLSLISGSALNHTSAAASTWTHSGGNWALNSTNYPIKINVTGNTTGSPSSLIETYTDISTGAGILIKSDVNNASGTGGNVVLQTTATSGTAGNVNLYSAGAINIITSSSGVITIGTGASGFVQINTNLYISGTTQVSGQFDGGTTTPAHNAGRVNFDGNFYAYEFFGSGAGLTGTASSLSIGGSAATVTGATQTAITSVGSGTNTLTIAGTGGLNLTASSATTGVGNFFKTSATPVPTGTTNAAYDGYFWATKIYNAVWNDLAEYMVKDPDDISEPGDVLVQTQTGLVKSFRRAHKAVVGVYSDTYGYALGAADKDTKYPVGLAGVVRVKVAESLEIGDLLVSGENGFAVRATEDEARTPGLVLGKVLEEKTDSLVSRIKILILHI
jgi:fibronectin-binding autotransporter adhesin